MKRKPNIAKGPCHVTGKVGFKGQQEVDIALAAARKRGRPESRGYRCKHCNCWHLTSMALA